MKIAGAPISWGVCEVPGWGYQMSPERVLTEMKEIGLTATEFGPQGWLPVDAEERAAVVSQFGLKPVGAFFLAVMHDIDRIVLLLERLADEPRELYFVFDYQYPHIHIVYYALRTTVNPATV